MENTGQDRADGRPSKWDNLPLDEIGLPETEEEANELVEHVRAILLAEERDVSTGAARKAIASIAHRATTLKTRLDGEGKEANAERRAAIEKVDKVRRAIRTGLDAVRDEVREPLERWEAAEKARAAKVEEGIRAIRAMADTSNVSLTALEARLEALEAREVRPDEFGERFAEAEAALDTAIKSVSGAIARERRAEAEKAELERLRAAEAERQREEAERQEREAQERAEADRRRKEEADKLAAAQRAVAEAEADRERAEKEAQEAREAAARAQIEAEEAAARREAEIKAAAEREERERKEAEEREAARVVAEQEEARRLEEARKEKEERERREAAHRKMRAHENEIEALKAIADILDDKEAAGEVIDAIKAGSVPHVTFNGGEV